MHEVSSVCRNGVAPIAWYYLAKASDTFCGRPPNYVWTSPQVSIQTGTRPGNTVPAGRRINNDGQFEITWQPVANAAAYTVLFEVPTGSDEVGNPYKRVIGNRVPVSMIARPAISVQCLLMVMNDQASSTRSVQRGIISQRWEGRSRRVAVNVVNSQGVWNLAKDSPVVDARW